MDHELQELIRMIEATAEIRGELPVPRDFIVEALERIGCGEETVERYPAGGPSLKGVFDIASRIYGAHSAQECIVTPIRNRLLLRAIFSYP